MRLFANFSYIVNLLILIAFIFFKDNKLNLLFFQFNIGFLFYILYIILHHFADALQNTTRNIARVYLMKKYEKPILNSPLVPSIQIHLTPNNFLPISFLYVFFHISYFSIVLYTNGWLIAIIMEIITFFLMLPVNYQYQLHLININKYLNKKNIRKEIEIITEGIDLTLLKNIVSNWVNEKVNPQIMWRDTYNYYLKKK